MRRIQAPVYTQVVKDSSSPPYHESASHSDVDALASAPMSTDDDYSTIRDAVAQILGVIDDPTRSGITETPDRVARMYLDLSHRHPFKLTCFKNSEGYDQMIVEDAIPFFSLCEHHMIPFFGTAKVAYIPRDEIVGLSKLARTVDYFSSGLKTQEGITNKVADLLMERLTPHGVGVQLCAEHLCMSMRGVRKPGAKTITTALRGVFKEAPTRDEFLR